MQVITLTVPSGPHKTQMQLQFMEDQRPYWEFRHVTIKHGVEAIEGEMRRRKQAGEPMMEPAKGVKLSTEVELLFDTDDCVCVLPDDERIVKAYKEYLTLPTATISNYTEMYKNRWFVNTGRGVVGPDPHRHYYPKEFYRWLGVDPGLAARFLAN